jgi:hypothetical protein
MISTPWYKGIGEGVDPRPAMDVLDFYVARRLSPLNGGPDSAVSLAEGRMASQSPFGDKKWKSIDVVAGQKRSPADDRV